MERNKYLDAALSESRKTARKLAEEIGVTPPQMGHWTSGLRNPGEKYIGLLAAALDVDEAWIAGYPGTIDVSDPDAGKTRHMRIMRTGCIDNYGTLYLTYDLEDDFPLAVLIGLDGTYFLPHDWQGKQPRMVEDIPDIGWVGPQGWPVVMMDGLPRVLGV